MHAEISAFLVSCGLTEKFTNILKFDFPILGYKLDADTKKYNIWEVDSSSWGKDVAEAWIAGNLILKNKITPVQIIMKKGQFEKYAKHPRTKLFTDFSEWCKYEASIEEEMSKESDKILESGTLAPGYLVHTHVADGCSTYKVTKINAKSVVLDHRHFGDGYMDQWLGCGRKISMEDFNRISHWQARAGKTPMARRNRMLFG